MVHVRNPLSPQYKNSSQRQVTVFDVLFMHFTLINASKY